MRGSLTVEEVHEISETVVEAVGDLAGQLSRSASRPTIDRVDAIVSSETARLLVGRDAEEQILGMLTLVVFQIPTGVRAWIEDVVVDDAARGQGLGSQLVRHAVALAQQAGARTVDLTSRPDRAAANALYVREGFELRQSNLYRRTL